MSHSRVGKDPTMNRVNQKLSQTTHFYMASRTITLPTTPSNAQDSVLLCVFTGKCGRLQPSGDTALVPLSQLAEGDVDRWALQASCHEDAYWLLCDGHRYNNLCFCCLCEMMICGSGGNLKGHIERHSSSLQTLKKTGRKHIFCF